MENRNIIIAILIVIIVILAAAVGIMMMPSLNAKEDSKITVTCNKTLYEGDNLTLKLTDLNKTPIQKERVNVTVTDNKGKVVCKKGLLTDSKGKASMELELDAGKYCVNVTFAGNENYTANSTFKNITVKEKVVEEPAVVEETASNSQTSQSSQSSEYGSYINDEWVSMSEAEYAERYPALYHEQSLAEGKYDKYHPQMYEVDRENGRID